MSNYKLNYWIEAVSSSFEENEMFFSPEMVKRIAKDMQNASENQGQAFGYDAIPSRRNAEHDEAVKGLQAKIKELESQILVYKQSVANRRGVRVENVYLEGNSVMYDK